MRLTSAIGIGKSNEPMPLVEKGYRTRQWRPSVQHIAVTIATATTGATAITPLGGLTTPRNRTMAVTVGRTMAAAAVMVMAGRA